MALRAGHGRGKGSPRLEVLPIAELPAGVPVGSAPADSDKAVRLRGEIAALRAELAGMERSDSARVKGATAKLMARVGGKTLALNNELRRIAAQQTAELSRLASELLPGMTAADPDFAKSLPLALEFIAVQTAELARDVGGGDCPNGPSSMVASAALQLAASRVLFARGDFKTASALANDSRQNIAAAHEYTAKLAVARRNVAPPAAPWLESKGVGS